MSWLDQMNNISINGVAMTTNENIQNFMKHNYHELFDTLGNKNIDHTGALLYGSLEYCSDLLIHNWYTIYDTFPSMIVSKELWDLHWRDIDVHIVMCSHNDKKYEFFVVSPKQISINGKDMNNILHVAYQFASTDTDQIEQLLSNGKKSWFSLWYYGINTQQDNGTWVTTIYMIHHDQNGLQFKIELIVWWQHPNIIKQAKNIFD